MRIETTQRCGWFTVWCLWACILPAIAADAPNESGVGGLRLRSSRAGAAWQQELQRAGFTTDALSRLQPLVEQARDQFLLTDTVSVTGGELVDQWLRSAPQDQWQRWEDSVRNDANLAWRRWEESRNEALLREFLRTFGASRQGLTGWKTLAHRAMDESRWDHAAAGLERVLNHRAANRKDRVQAVIELVAVRVRQQRIREAMELATNHAELLAGQSIRWGGQTQPVADVLRVLLPEEPPPAPVISARPSLSLRWRMAIPLPTVLQAYWPEWRRDYRAEGAWLNPIAEPAIAGGKVFVQTLSGLEARDLVGRQLSKTDHWRVRQDDWQRMLEQAEKWGSRDWRGQVLDQLVRRESADSVLGRITTDGERVFAITGSAGSEFDRLVPGKGTTTAQRDDNTTPGHLENRLSAYSVRTGELLWQVGGPAAGPTYRFAQMFFCGPPSVIDGTLYVVAQQDTELQLIAMDAVRGESLWSTVLGDVPRSLSADPARQRVACPVIWNDGTLIVTTANGAVIAVDALTHAPRWAYRYPTTPRDTHIRPREQNTNFQPDPWWDAWRDVRIVTAGNFAVFVSPESQKLHAMDRRTGEPRWTIPRNEALWLTGVTEQHVYVAGPHHIAAFELATGKPVWRTAIPESGGRPLLTATEILQPLANRHLACIALTDGRLHLARGVDNPVMGNLVTDGESWVSVSGHHIIRWSDEVWEKQIIDSMEKSDPTDVVPKMLTARLNLEKRDHKAARAVLPTPQYPPEILLQVSRQVSLAELAAEPAIWREKLKELPTGAFTDETFEFMEALITAARKNGDVVDAGRLLLDRMLSVQNETVLPAGGERLVRADLACLGLWDDMWRQADASQRTALSQLLEESWQQAAVGSDPFALARLVELWHPLSIVRQKVAQTTDGLFLGRSFAATELQLLSLAAMSSGVEAGRLWSRLAHEQSQAGFPIAAATSWERVKQLDPGAQVPDLAIPPRMPWPQNSPLIETQQERNDDIHQLAIPLDIDSSPFFQDLDVAVDRQYRRVYFTSNDQQRSWNLPLTRSTTDLRSIPHLRMGWGRGRILLLRVGSELFAMAPFDERGEPVARILWTIDMLGGSMILAEHARPENLPMIPGVREEDFRVLSAFGRPLAQMGPVRASYVCYHEKGKLVSLDTFTGRKRWECYDLPFDARSFGDEEHVLVWSPQQQTVDVLRAIDGQRIETRAWDAHPDRVILLRESLAYRQIPQTIGWQLVCENLLTGQTVWSQQMPAGSTPVVLDQETVAIAESAGRLRILSLHDGHERAEPISFSPMPQLERAIMAKDAQTWFVAISNRISRQTALQPANNANSHRTPAVDGPLIAIDRQTLRPRWQMPLARSPFLLDQPRTAPLLMLNYKLGTPDQIANRATNGVIRLLDKQTGREVLQREGANVLGFATFQTNPNRGLVEVRLETETVRLRYHPHPPAPTSPEP